MWRMPVYATRDTVIHVNDRIAQFRIVENQPEIVFEKVEHLTGKIAVALAVPDYHNNNSNRRRRIILWKIV